MEMVNGDGQYVSPQGTLDPDVACLCANVKSSGILFCPAVFFVFFFLFSRATLHLASHPIRGTLWGDVCCPDRPRSSHWLARGTLLVRSPFSLVSLASLVSFSGRSHSPPSPPSVYLATTVGLAPSPSLSPPPRRRCRSRYHATYHWQTTFPTSNCSYPTGHGSSTTEAPVQITKFNTTFHEYAVERGPSLTHP